MYKKGAFSPARAKFGADRNAESEVKLEAGGETCQRLYGI